MPGLSTTAKIMVNQFERLFDVTKDVPRRIVYQLTRLNAQVANAKKTLNEPEAEFSGPEAQINTASSALDSEPTKSAFEYKTSITPTIQILKNDLTERQNTLKQLKNTVDTVFGNQKFKEIINDFKAGKPKSQTQAAISTLEKNQKEILEGRIKSFKINSDSLFTRLSNFASKLVKDTENLLGRSLGIAAPKPTPQQEEQQKLGGGR